MSLQNEDLFACSGFKEVDTGVRTADKNMDAIRRNCEAQHATAQQIVCSYLKFFWRFILLNVPYPDRPRCGSSDNFAPVVKKGNTGYRLVIGKLAAPDFVLAARLCFAPPRPLATRRKSLAEKRQMRYD
jgi:hypothetical protein